jgi:hypothetical protein
MSGYVSIPFMHRMRARPKEPGGETGEMRMRGKEGGTQATTKQYDVQPSDTEREFYEW